MVTPPVVSGPGYRLEKLFGPYHRWVVGDRCSTQLPEHLCYNDALHMEQGAKDVQGADRADHAVDA